MHHMITPDMQKMTKVNTVLRMIQIPLTGGADALTCAGAHGTSRHNAHGQV